MAAEAVGTQEKTQRAEEGEREGEERSWHYNCKAHTLLQNTKDKRKKYRNRL